MKLKKYFKKVLFQRKKNKEEKTLKWNMHPTKLPTKRKYYSVTAINEDEMIIIGGSRYHYDSLSSVELFDIKKTNDDAIVQLPDMLEKRSQHSAVLLNDHIYIIGGECHASVQVHRLDVSAINSLSSISSSTNDLNWENNVIPDIDDIRRSAGAVVYDEYIYVFGGMDRYRRFPLSSGIRYKPPSPSSDSSPSQNWEPIAPMKGRRSSFSAVNNGDKIYIIGGFDCINYGTHLLDSMEIYDPASNTFEDGPNLPIPLSSMQAISIGHYIVVIGGRTNNENGAYGKANGLTFLFNVKTQEWKTIHSTSINTPRCNHAAVLLENDKIVIFGGIDNDWRRLDTVEWISFKELLRSLQWDRKKEYILLRYLVERGRASPAIISKRKRKTETKEEAFQRACLQHLFQKLNDDVFGMVLQFV